MYILFCQQVDTILPEDFEGFSGPPTIMTLYLFKAALSSFKYMSLQTLIKAITEFMLPFFQLSKHFPVFNISRFAPFLILL